MAASSKPAYDAEDEKRGKLDKGGLDCGYVYEETPECPALPECDEMTDYGKKGMTPEGAYPIIIKNTIGGKAS